MLSGLARRRWQGASFFVDWLYLVSCRRLARARIMTIMHRSACDDLHPCVFQFRELLLTNSTWTGKVAIHVLE